MRRLSYVTKKEREAENKQAKRDFRVSRDLESQLRAAFEEVIKDALREVRRQNIERIGRPFEAFQEWQAGNGQRFTVKIEAEPAPVPSLKLN